MKDDEAITKPAGAERPTVKTVLRRLLAESWVPALTYVSFMEGRDIVKDWSDGKENAAICMALLIAMGVSGVSMRVLEWLAPVGSDQRMIWLLVLAGLIWGVLLLLGG